MQVSPGNVNIVYYTPATVEEKHAEQVINIQPFRIVGSLQFVIGIFIFCLQAGVYSKEEYIEVSYGVGYVFGIVTIFSGGIALGAIKSSSYDCICSYLCTNVLSIILGIGAVTTIVLFTVFNYDYLKFADLTERVLVMMLTVACFIQLIISVCTLIIACECIGTPGDNVEDTQPVVLVK